MINHLLPNIPAFKYISSWGCSNSFLNNHLPLDFIIFLLWLLGNTAVLFSVSFIVEGHDFSCSSLSTFSDLILENGYYLQFPI